MKQLTAFLDANVLYSAGLRDLLMRLALQGLFRIKWPEQVHEEWMRNLLAKRPDLTREKLERTRQLMERAAPDSLVKGYTALHKSLIYSVNRQVDIFNEKVCLSVCPSPTCL